MANENLNALAAFATVAEERSFTRAAVKLGVSQSAASQTVRALEERLGLQLLRRTTRSVSTTEAGEKLLQAIRPALDNINAQVAAMGDLREKPAGTIRITTSPHAATTILWPAFERLLPHYPDINVELSTEMGFRDIVADGFDAGVRLGEQVDKDMIAVRIGPDMRMAAVASPAYVASRGLPATPQELAGHDAINVRMPTAGGLYVWDFEKDGRRLNVRMESRVTANDGALRVKAALAGFGIAYLLEDHVRDAVADGRLVRMLEDWCPAFPGYHLYYPSRRLPSPAFALVVEALRRHPR